MENNSSQKSPMELLFGECVCFLCSHKCIDCCDMCRIKGYKAANDCCDAD